LPFAEKVLLTDPFGYRTAPVEQFHDAQDFAAAAGTPVLAIADGTVLETGFASDGCGFGVKLTHRIDGKKVTSRYCHMQMGSNTLATGDTVKMGSTVGRVGSTGLAFGPHLHFALVVDDVPTDPMPFLAKYSRIDR
jgi:murein DD-endopeptidase MepM/ murein hydrolase activator NlpD